MSYIHEYLFEVNEFPKYGIKGEFHTVKDYFYYDSDVQIYGYRQLVIPLSFIINKEAVTDYNTVHKYIQQRTPILKYTNGNWSFEKYD